jgi:hypothetical protein
MVSELPTAKNPRERELSPHQHALFLRMQFGACLEFALSRSDWKLAVRESNRRNNN